MSRPCRLVSHDSICVRPKQNAGAAAAGTGLLLALLLASHAFGATSQPSKASPNAARMAGREPYCGLYCVYAALRYYGRTVDFAKMLDPKYVGTAEGSSVRELQSAAEDNGLYTATVANLSSDVLARTKSPVILHVRRDDAREVYDHYILLLEVNGDKAVVFDPSTSVTSAPIHEIAWRWDGKALFLSKSPISMSRMLGPTYGQILACLLLGVPVAVLALWVNNRWRRAPMSSSRRVRLGFLQAILLVVFAFGLGLGYHRLSGSGLLRESNAVKEVVRNHLADFLSIVRAEDIPGLIHSDTVFVDCRFPREFALGHLPGAINVPVFFGQQERLEAMGATRKNKRVVLYCKSKGCLYSGEVALRLLDDGYSNLSLFRGGWDKWQKIARSEKRDSAVQH